MKRAVVIGAGVGGITVAARLERDGYRLRRDYSTRHPTMAWLRMLWIASRVTGRHVAYRTTAALRLGAARMASLRRPETDGSRLDDSLSLHATRGHAGKV